MAVALASNNAVLRIFIPLTLSAETDRMPVGLWMQCLLDAQPPTAVPMVLEFDIERCILATIPVT